MNVFVARIDVDLGQRIVESGLLDSFFVSCFEPVSQHSELATVFKLFDEFGNRADTDAVEKLLDVNFVTVEIQECSEYFWSSIRIYFEKVDFNALQLLSSVQVSGQIFYVAVHIAKVDKGTGVCEFAFHEEVFNAFGVVECCFLNDAFNFFEVSESSTGFNVLEVDIGIVSLGQNVTEEEKEAFVGSELLQDLD